MEKNELKKLLLESTEKLIAQLSEMLDKNSGLYNEMIILSKKYYEGKMEINLGTIKFEDWNILKTQVDKGLLDLVDRVDKPNLSRNSDSSVKKDIAIEDAIEWVSNALIDKGYYEWEQTDSGEEREEIFKSWKIREVQIGYSGQFVITEIYEFNCYSYKNGSCYHKYESTATINYSGNLRDIGNITIEKDNERKDVYYIRFIITNPKKCFFLNEDEKIETEWKNNRDEPQQKQNKSHESQFRLILEDLELTQKFKNAIDYLSIHFGRKEDAF